MSWQTGYPRNVVQQRIRNEDSSATTNMVVNKYVRSSIDVPGLRVNVTPFGAPQVSPGLYDCGFIQSSVIGAPVYYGQSKPYIRIIPTAPNVLTQASFLPNGVHPFTNSLDDGLAPPQPLTLFVLGKMPTGAATFQTVVGIVVIQLDGSGSISFTSPAASNGVNELRFDFTNVFISATAT